MNFEKKADAKLTEDEIIKLLMEYLVSQSWSIESYCLGQKRGYDIVATRSGERLYVGKAADFLFDTKNLEAKRQATDKMKKTLIRRLEEGTI